MPPADAACIEDHCTLPAVTTRPISQPWLTTSGVITEGELMAVVHVYPTRDLIEHETEGDDCACGVTLEAVPCDDGSFGWVVLHHSLDGREKHE